MQLVALVGMVEPAKSGTPGLSSARRDKGERKGGAWSDPSGELRNVGLLQALQTRAKSARFDD